MDLLRSVIIAFLFCSCAKVGYVIKQAPGQLALIYGARDNQEILNDPKISEKEKDKIRLIGTYKKYFYNFFEKKPGEIYSKTKILDREAVSYLVIASRFDEIKAKRECFPFLGCFPYLGFFSKEEAIEYGKNLKESDYHIWVRPVYAYSSLNYFTDPIMSSFFKYDDIQLAELVFHELFHSIFFVKDEVDLNENLANYFAKKMVYLYFDYTDAKILEVKSKRAKDREISKVISGLVLELDNEYRRQKPKDSKEGRVILNRFLTNRFYPRLMLKCGDNCRYLKNKWNNATFAAFQTYEKESDLIGDMHRKSGLGLKAFYDSIQKKYKRYQESDRKGTFRDYLLKK